MPPEPRHRSTHGPRMQSIAAYVAIAAVAAAFVILALAGLLAPFAALVSFVAVAGITLTAMRLATNGSPLPQPAHKAATTMPHAAIGSITAVLPEPALALDRQGTVVFSNDQAKDVLGLDRPGRHLSAVVRAPVVLDALDEALRTGRRVQVEFEQRVPVERRFDVHVTPLPKDAAGPGGPRSPAVLMLMRDLTRQERLERMRADFVANASHELRTPLAAVIGFIETLQGSARDDPEARSQFLQLMHSQAARMARLVDDLLSLSQIELNVGRKPDQTVDLARTVRDVVETMQPLAGDSGVDLVVDLPVAPLEVTGDRDQLVQVIQNLIENAIRYGGSGGRVDVSVSLQSTGAGGQRHADIIVRDFGPGIAPEHLPRLTERFYRVDVTDSRAKGGTGLGLAIVKHILNRHGGRLLIDSRIGEGSTFIARLPAKADSTANESAGNPDELRENAKSVQDQRDVSS